MSLRIVLLSSPYLSGVWTETAAELRTRGAVAVVGDSGPSFEPTAIIEGYRACCAIAPHVVVAHSNAALYLPGLVDALPGAVGIFVDAAIPPESGEVPVAPSGARTQLASVERDGLLPGWPSWWPEAAWRTMIRSDRRRAEIERAAPAVPGAYLDRLVRLPPGWRRRRYGYLSFQEGYLQAMAEARELGWPARRVPGTHLEMINDPQQTAGVLLELAACLG